MRIAIDVGYSNVKAVSDKNHKIIFPSVTSVAKQNPLNGVNLFNPKQHHVKLNGQEKLVGNAALDSLTAISTLNREKPPEIHDLFILAASYLCGAGAVNPSTANPIHLAVGLPLAYYRSQKNTLKDRLLNIGADISVNDGVKKYISFNNVSVFPQGLGVLFSIPSFPDEGQMGLIDIGCFTTDYLLFSIEDGEPVPIIDACGSIEAGTYLVQQDLASVFQSITGAPLAPFKYIDALRSAQLNKPIHFQGKKVSLTHVYEQSCKQTAQLITESIRSVWSSRGEYLTSTVFAGGGSEMLKLYLQESHSDATIANDPVFANSQGFLKLIS